MKSSSVLGCHYFKNSKLRGNIYNAQDVPLKCGNFQTAVVVNQVNVKNKNDESAIKYHLIYDVLLLKNYTVSAVQGMQNRHIYSDPCLSRILSNAGAVRCAY
jgi:hypothetical protein